MEKYSQLFGTMRWYQGKGDRENKNKTGVRFILRTDLCLL